MKEIQKVLDKLTFDKIAQQKLSQIITFYNEMPILENIKLIAYSMETKNFDSVLFFGEEDVFKKYNVFKKESHEEKGVLNAICAEIVDKSYHQYNLDYHTESNFRIVNIDKNDVTLALDEKTIYFSKEKEVNSEIAKFQFDKSNNLIGAELQFKNKNTNKTVKYNKKEIEIILNKTINKNQEQSMSL